MRDRVFQEAYDRVRSRLADDVWLAMQPSEITRAIYEEMRVLDAERGASLPTATAPEPHSGDHQRNAAS